MEKSRPSDQLLVEFSQADSDNPRDWPSRKKWAVTNVLSATGFNRILVSTIMAPALSSIAEELHMGPIESAMALSIYLLATAFGPLFIGPLSEVYGRQNILHASNLWFLGWNMACGFANTKELLIASRFLAGFGASAVYSLAAGVLSDVWTPQQRGKSLAIYLLVPLLAVAVGPTIGGFTTNRTTWRWMFWSTSIFQAVMMVFSITTFKETYSPVILKRRAKRLRAATGSNYQTLEERFYDEKPFFSIISHALTRPVRLLATHPIIQLVGVISAFSYGLLYIALSTFADLWSQKYGQSVEISGLHYISIAVGEVLGSLLAAPLMDRLYKRMERRKGEHLPEHRIPLTFLGTTLAPFGFLLYGWAAQYHLHWAVVDLGMILATFGLQIGGMPLQAYVTDAYGNHTSSAMAASQFLRSLTAFCFPLFAPAMYKSLGYGWGNSLLAFSSLLVGIPAPLLVWKFGAKLRAKAETSF